MKRFSSLILTALLILSLIPCSVFAAEKTITSGIDLPYINNDSFGKGYEWDNLDQVLKLNGINLDTQDQFGIKLPSNSTIELNGDNYIKASAFAIYCLGAVTFTGNGTLTVTAAEHGIACFNTLSNDNLIFRSGKITVNGAKNGIYAENTPIIFSGAEVNVKSAEKAISGYDVKFVSGTVTLEAPIVAKGTVTVSNANLSISANSPAITAKNITFTDVDVSVGQTPSALNKSEDYNAEHAIKTVATKKENKKGYLFGGKLPAFVDYIAIALIIVTVASVIVVPYIIKRKKTLALIAQSETIKSKKSKK